MATKPNNSRRPLTDGELVDINWISKQVGLDNAATRRLLSGPGGPPRVELNTRVHRWWKSDIYDFLQNRTMMPGRFLSGPALTTKEFLGRPNWNPARSRGGSHGKR